MKITIDENTKELIIEGTYTIAQLKEYLNLSGSLMDFKIVLKKEELSDKLWKDGLINVPCKPYNPFKDGVMYSADGKIATQEETNIAVDFKLPNITSKDYTGKMFKRKASEVGAKVHEQIENYIKNTNDTL